LDILKADIILYKTVFLEFFYQIIVFFLHAKSGHILMRFYEKKHQNEHFFKIHLVSRFLRILEIFIDILKAYKIFFKIVFSEFILLSNPNHDDLMHAQ